jgi:hypothetical protein
MKKCPKCSAVYKDELLYCLSDGTALVEQPAPAAPTVVDFDDSETIVRGEPIVIDFAKPEPESEPIMIDFSDVETVVHPPKQVEELPQVTVIEKPVAKTSNYALFLVIGLFIGGGLVLLTLFLARTFFSGGDAATNNAAPVNQTAPVSGSNQNTNQTIQNAAARHEAPNPAADVNLLNGDVIAVNAYVRALPNKDSAQIDVLPIGDRLQIERRENDSSPWYQIKCEHGTTGWMHGNTIAFKQ